MIPDPTMGVDPVDRLLAIDDLLAEILDRLERSQQGPLRHHALPPLIRAVRVARTQIGNDHG